ncbi:MAG: acetate--CoA ligase family protein [Deltaproteobacteria bacterium]|nr:acetate--CoA ligase family protein [Deltaproteobacteria bacterium]
MEQLFYPRSVVVIGVSTRPENLGRNIVYNLIDFGYDGELFLVGRRPGCFLGHRIHTDFAALPAGIELAVILTPAAAVLDTMRACIDRGITRMVIETGGFREFSAAGARIEAELLALAREHGVKFVGPNGISILNRHNGLCLPFMRLNPREVQTGGMSIISQSGGMALTYLGLGSSENLGVAKMISMGNKTCLDESDYLDYLATDEETAVIGVYLESLSRGRRFFAAVAAAGKPVILHKANTSELSDTIARSHTAALANDDQVIDAACRQYGVYRVDTFRQFINHVKAFSMPPMRGGNLMVISRSGGHAVVAADAAAAYGFSLVELTPALVDLVQGHSRAQVIRPTNPLDLGDLFDIDFYIEILHQVLKRPDVDGVLFNHVYQADVEGEASLHLVRAADELSRRYRKPVAMCVFSGARSVAELKKRISFPLFTEPAEGIAALAVSRADHERRSARQKKTAPARPSLLTAEARTAIGGIIRQAREQQDGELALDQVLTIFARCGLTVVPWQLVREEDDLEAAAAGLGLPLAAKVVALSLSHKSDAGGVRLGLETMAAVGKAVAGLREKFAGRPGFRGIMLQRMAPAGVELIVGGRRDPACGPVVLLGMGGIYAEVFRDTALRLAPLDADLVDEMVAELKGAPIIRGARGQRPLDQKSLRQVLFACADLLAEFPAVQQIDVNPLLLTPEAGLLVDGRIFLGGDS